MSKIDIDIWSEIAKGLGLAAVTSPAGEVTVFNRDARERGFLWFKPYEIFGASELGEPERDMDPQSALRFLWELSRPVE